MASVSMFQRAGARWLEAMQGQSQAWLFIGKALLAFYLSGWLAMRLEMPSPFTVMVTVLVVSTPQPGAVLGKSVHRALGTLGGCLVGLLLVGVFPQQPVLLMLSMALWVALMAAGSLLNRGFRAYSFVLSGYSVSMVVLPSLNQPHAVFDAAIWRVAEVGLAIIVSCCVFDLLLPSRLRTPVLASAQRNAEQLLDWLVHSGRAGLAATSAQQQAILRAAAAYDDLRSLAYFDDPSLRASNALLHELNQRYLHCLSAYESLQRLRARAARDQHLTSLALVDKALQPLLDDLEQALTSASKSQISAVLHRWQAHLASVQLTPDDPLTELASGRLQHFAEALQRYWQHYECLDIDKAHQSTSHAPKVVRFWRAVDPLALALVMIRAGGMTFAVGLLWMNSGWQAGASGLFMMIALLSILSAAPQPLLAYRSIVVAHIWAPLMGLICYSLLPQMNEFVWLLLITLPFMLTLLYLLTRPQWSAAAMCMSMSFMVVLMISPAPEMDAAWVINDMLSVYLGVLLVGLSFVLIPSVTYSRGQRRRLHAMLRGQVSKVLHWPRKQLAERLASRHYDLVIQLLGMSRADSSASLRVLQWAHLTYETASALIQLRHGLAQGELDKALKQPLTTLMGHLDTLYRHPNQAHWQASWHALQAALPLSNERQWRQPLLQLQAVLSDSAHVLARQAQFSSLRSS